MILSLLEERRQGTSFPHGRDMIRVSVPCLLAENVAVAVTGFQRILGKVQHAFGGSGKHYPRAKIRYTGDSVRGGISCSQCELKRLMHFTIIEALQSDVRTLQVGAPCDHVEQISWWWGFRVLPNGIMYHGERSQRPQFNWLNELRNRTCKLSTHLQRLEFHVRYVVSFCSSDLCRNDEHGDEGTDDCQDVGPLSRADHHCLACVAPLRASNVEIIDRDCESDKPSQTSQDADRKPGNVNPHQILRVFQNENALLPAREG
jgi:hypothetical protein